MECIKSYLNRLIFSLNTFGYFNLKYGNTENIEQYTNSNYALVSAHGLVSKKHNLNVTCE